MSFRKIASKLAWTLSLVSAIGLPDQLEAFPAYDGYGPFYSPYYVRVPCDACNTRGYGGSGFINTYAGCGCGGHHRQPRRGGRNRNRRPRHRCC